jgi:GTP-binding protein
MPYRETVRNLAVIAHVDHGKTTLLDAMLRQSGVFRANQEVAERALDRMDQERERGITILAKCTALDHGGLRIHLVDTPGHADFGGEVERVLRLVDSVLLLVDAGEGPMPQTRFVLEKALTLGHRAIVVINKIDREQARPDVVLDEVFDLFVALGANDRQLDFPVVYASAKEGWAVRDLADERRDLEPLFQAIREEAAPPEVTPDGAVQAQIAMLDYDDYMGRIGIGRIYRGAIRRGDRAVVVRPGGEPRPFRVTSLMGFLGLQRIDRDAVDAGDLFAIAGAPDVTVGDTICAAEVVEPLPAIAVDPPTITMLFRINDSPFAGKEGRFVTSRQLRDRLWREGEHNVSLRFENTDRPEVFRVSGRGVLQLGVLIETLRREGYELQVSAPEVVTRSDPETGGFQEPFERIEVQVGQTYSGTVIEKLSARGARMHSMDLRDDGTARLHLTCPSRGLIGYRSQFLTDTRGTGILASVFSHYGPFAGPIVRRKEGAMIVMDPCDTVAYGLWGLQDRGVLFIHPGEKVYAGQVIGLHAKENDLVVNPGRQKKLTNIRAANADEAIRLIPPFIPTLEQCLELIDDDELVECTPKSIRLRKRVLDHSQRRKVERRASAEAE